MPDYRSQTFRMSKVGRVAIKRVQVSIAEGARQLCANLAGRS